MDGGHGFQFTVTLTRAFEDLTGGTKLTHVVALLCVAVAVVLLMTPAALHRLAFGGEDAPEFVKVGSALVIAAPVPLALGIAIDTYVASRRALDSEQAAIWGSPIGFGDSPRSLVRLSASTQAELRLIPRFPGVSNPRALGLPI